jgi:hypothetical protein
MKHLASSPPCVFFTAILASGIPAFSGVHSLLIQKYGAPIHQLDPVQFKQTDYYVSEMGSNLVKGFIAFQPPFHPDQLPVRKRETRGLEWKFGYRNTRGFHRTVNIDPGYVSLYHVALATSKNFSHRLCLSEGIYGEVTLLYRISGWELLPWTYPDYKIPGVQSFLSECRTSLIHYMNSIA